MTTARTSGKRSPVYVSVIVPVYNDPAGVETLVEALLAQSYPRDAFEVIIADNGSTDETPGVIARCRKRHPDLVHPVVESQVRSSYAARNRGIRVAKGDILAFTDADCLPVPHWIEAGVASLQEESAACGGGRIEFTYLLERPNVYEYYDSARKLNQQAYVERSGFAATANFFARRELFKRYGLFRHDLVSGGDYEFGRRVTGQAEKMIYIPDAVVRHPARSTFAAVYRKSKRVALGERQLQKLGLLERDGLPWRNLLPARTWPVHQEWSGSLSTLEKLHLIVLQSLFRWLNLWIRLK